MKRTKPCSRNSQSRSGAALVETAFMLPILLSVTFGVVEFGRGLMVSNLITNAAREGARLGIINGVTSAEVKTAVAEQVNQTVGASIPTSNVTIDITPYGSNPDPNDECANCRARDLVEVEVFVPYADVGYFFRFLANVNLKGQAAMRHE